MALSRDDEMASRVRETLIGFPDTYSPPRSGRATVVLPEITI